MWIIPELVVVFWIIIALLMAGVILVRSDRKRRASTKGPMSICPNDQCRQVNGRDAKFCARCGTLMHKNSSEPTSESPRGSQRP